MLVREYHTDIIIDAPIQNVWTYLTDFPTYPEWNPVLGWMKGDFQVDGRIQMFVKPLGRSFYATLKSFKSPEAMAWVGVQVAPWFLSGEHYYRLESLSDTSTQLFHGEYFRGLASVFIKRTTLAEMEETFVQHNQLLKERVEHG